MRAWKLALCLMLPGGCSKPAPADEIAKLDEQACNDPARPALESRIPGGGRFVWRFPDGTLALGSWQRPCSHALGKCLCDLVSVPKAP